MAVFMEEKFKDDDADGQKNERQREQHNSARWATELCWRLQTYLTSTTKGVELGTHDVLRPLRIVQPLDMLHEMNLSYLKTERTQF
jgi:hypothetical protein